MRFALLLLLGLAIVGAACGGGLPTKEQVERQGWENFQTAVASDRNYDVYWMGREFTAGGLTYQGPDANAPAGSDRIGAGINPPTADGIEMYYTSPCGCSNLTLTLYSRPAWDRFAGRSVQPNEQKKTVQVNGQPAQLWTSFYSPGEVASRWVVVDYGSTVVKAITGAVVPKTPGPDPNPLMDEATFLAVMQNLRPYPE